MTFDVWPTPLAATQIDALRGKARDAAKERLQELRATGCKAARWRMSGPTVDQLCEVYLSDQWRMIVAFPAADEVCVICVGEHKDGHRDNIYDQVYRLLGIDPPTGRARVACCKKAAEAPIDPDLVTHLVLAAKRLT